MTRTYALKRLLEHGPMTASEIRVCTGWESRAVHSALHKLLTQKIIRRAHRQNCDSRGYAYLVVA